MNELQKLDQESDALYRSRIATLQDAIELSEAYDLQKRDHVVVTSQVTWTGDGNMQVPDNEAREFFGIGNTSKEESNIFKVNGR